MPKLHNAWSQLCVESFNVQLWKTKTNDRTQLYGMFLMPLGPVFCHFPHWWTQAWKMTNARRAFCFILIYVYACDFLKGIFRRLKGGKQASNAKGKTWTFKTRAGNQTITLTSNFGIECFGHTILSLWSWLFSTKHPVIKGRLVVGLLFFFPFKFWQNSSPSPCTNLREREKESKKERWLAFFFFCFLLFFFFFSF